MSCDGHWGHHFEPTDECSACGHPRSEHDRDGYWADDRGTRVEARLLEVSLVEDTQANRDAGAGYVLPSEPQP